jgi:hypothetical protein
VLWPLFCSSQVRVNQVCVLSSQCSCSKLYISACNRSAISTICMCRPARVHSSSISTEGGCWTVWLNVGICVVRYRIQVKARNINYKACTARMRSAMTRAYNSEKWFPSFVVARRLGIESSALGRLTGGCRVTVGDKSFDVGLSLRHGTDLCVPDLACPSPEGSCVYFFEHVLHVRG